ncbi:hypothetical protein RNJ44_00461 [Nakaseomyces bracarensis]|uniref:Uncharacterized protein n=1 Tax=Nakaseomyces bracarensis TaxID=273131 RepID=A0ABR4NSU8_9SACH
METVFDSELDEPLSLDSGDDFMNSMEGDEVLQPWDVTVEKSVGLQEVDLGAEIALVKQLKQLEESDDKSEQEQERGHGYQQEQEQEQADEVEAGWEEKRRRQVVVGQLRRSGTLESVPAGYIDEVVGEVFSDKYRDWHFITGSCNVDISGEVRDVLMLLRDYGVSSERVETLRQLKICDPQYDNMGSLLPVRQMLDDFQELYTTVVPHAPSIDTYCKIFILFILDRKVYDSYECDSVWCTCMLKVLRERITTKDFVRIYTTVVDPQNYFMHYRVLKLLPSIKEPLLEQIISPYSKDTLIKCFNTLLDNGQFKELLYFLLLVVGCNYIPFGANDTLNYFTTCVADIFDGSSSAPEISIIRNYLQMFITL